MSGSLAIGPDNSVYVGLINEYGSTTGFPSEPVLTVCAPGPSNAFTCKTGSQAFPFEEGDISPFQQSVGIAAGALVHGDYRAINGCADAIGGWGASDR